MRMIDRHGDAELLDVLVDDGRSLTEAEDEQGLDAGRAFDLGELRAHVGVFGTVSVFGDKRDAHLRRGDFGFLLAGLAEAAGLRQ